MKTFAAGSFAFGASIILLSSVMFAQIARQGDPSIASNPMAFRSPMILETAFIAADKSTWGKGWVEAPEYHDLGKFTCDGVSLRGRMKNGTWTTSGLAMSTKQRQNNKVEVRIRATVTNPKDNHDKVATLFLEILNGEKVIASATLGPIETEEDESPDTGYATVVLSADAFDEPGSKPGLRITMKTRDD